MLDKTSAATVPVVDTSPMEVDEGLGLGLSQFINLGRPDGTIEESRGTIVAFDRPL